MQLLTQSKLFSGAPTTFGAEPNTQACAIDLALPGVLPVLNEKVIGLAVKFGLSISADLANHSVFARKKLFFIPIYRKVTKSANMTRRLWVLGI